MWLRFCPVLARAYWTNNLSENVLMDYEQDFCHRSFVSWRRLRLKFQICSKSKSICAIDGKHIWGGVMI